MQVLACWGNLKYNLSLIVDEEKKKSQCISVHYIFPEKKIRAVLLFDPNHKTCSHVHVHASCS